jgi:DNA repair protein RadC
MTGRTTYRVRELEVRYKAMRLPLPIAGQVSQPRDAAQLAAAVLDDLHIEKFIALHFNTKRRLIGVHVVSVGCLDGTVAHPREIFTAALLTNAASLVVAHNHPSGDQTPSSDDVALIRRLAEAGRILGVDLDDALIIGEQGRYYSFREVGVL